MQLQKGQYFILATGTDAGKTFLLTEICKKLREKNFLCDAIKPVASGFSIDDSQSDSAKILQSLGREFSLENIEEITPYRFLAPLSPSIAALYENNEINFVKLQNFCEKKIAEARKINANNNAKGNSKNIDFFFIEGAGGVMTPINRDKTFLDLVAILKIPVLLLAGNYLGSISHTLCAVEALRQKSVAIEKIIINNHQNHNCAVKNVEIKNTEVQNANAENASVKISDTIAEIARFSNLATVDINQFINSI